MRDFSDDTHLDRKKSSVRLITLEGPRMMHLVLCLMVVLGVAMDLPAEADSEVHHVSTSSGVMDHLDSTATGSLAWCIAQLSGAKGVVVLPPGESDYVISEDYVIPENVTLLRHSGNGIISVAAGKTLAIKGNFDAPPEKAFGGLGKVVFAAGFSPIISEWFGNDLYKAYNSATSQSLITYYSDQTISRTVVMDKTDVSIDGGNGKAYKVSPSVEFPEGDYMLQFGEYEVHTGAFRHVANMNIDCSAGGLGAKKWASGIQARSAPTTAYITNVTIGYAKEWAVLINGDNDASKDYPIRLSFTNIVTGNPGEGCLKIYNRYNMQMSVPTLIDTWYCDGGFTAPRGFFIDANNTESLPIAIDMRNVHITSVDGIGFEALGQVHMSWTGGSVENCGTAPGVCRAWNTSKLAFKATKGVSGIGVDAIINRVQFQTLLYADEYSPITLCNCDLNYQVSLHGGCYQIGKIGDYSHAGPPNFPYNRVLDAQTSPRPRYSQEWSCYGQSYPLCQYNTGTVIKDGYGVRWQADHGGSVTDNSTGWRALDMPIKMPFTYADLQTRSRYTIWYPTEGFVVKEIVAQMKDWDCSISFGTADDDSCWLQGGNATVLSEWFWRPQSTHSDPSSRIHSRPWTMASQRCPGNTCPGSTYPDVSASGKFNYIQAIRKGTCTAGEGLLMIHGAYTNALPGGSKP
jgi:hypothetical protein